MLLPTARYFSKWATRSILFLNNLLKHPDKAFDYARLYASSVASILAWGFRAKDFDSFFYKDFYDFVDQVSQHVSIHSLGNDCFSGSVLLNQVRTHRSNRHHGCGIYQEHGKGELTTSEALWTRHGAKHAKWSKTVARKGTYATR